MARTKSRTDDRNVLRTPRWYLAQAKKARTTAAKARGRRRSALLAVADQLETLARFAETLPRH